MSAFVPNDPVLMRPLQEQASRAEAEARAAQERTRTEAIRMQAMHFAIQAWPSSMAREPGTLRNLADEIHGFLTGERQAGDEEEAP